MASVGTWPELGIFSLLSQKFLITPNFLYLDRLFTNGYTQRNLLQAKQLVRYAFTPINLSLTAGILSLNSADKLGVFCVYLLGNATVDIHMSCRPIDLSVSVVFTSHCLK